jgi:hypothetical protein
MIIDATSDADRARIDERLGRLDELSIKDFVMDDDLNPGSKPNWIASKPGARPWRRI